MSLAADMWIKARCEVDDWLILKMRVRGSGAWGFVSEARMKEEGWVVWCGGCKAMVEGQWMVVD
jgi:hypothetical protein